MKSSSTRTNIHHTYFQTDLHVQNGERERERERERGSGIRSHKERAIES